MTKELIEEARQRAAIGADVDPIDAARLLNELADELESAESRLAARQPTEDDREALACLLWESTEMGQGLSWERLSRSAASIHASLTAKRYVSDTYAQADAMLAAGFSRAAVPDAATERIAELEATIRLGTEGSRHLYDDLKRTEAERDAALAAVERARALHPNVSGECHLCSDENGPKSWPCPTVAALDGAPESEVKP